MIDPETLLPATEAMTSPWTRAHRQSWPPAWRRRCRARTSLATVLLPLFALVVGNVAAGAGPGIGGQKPPGFMAAPTGFLATPAAAAGSVAELVWVSDGEPSLPLQKPNAVTADPRGNLWVTDGDHDRFVIFSPDGAALEA